MNGKGIEPEPVGFHMCKKHGSVLPCGQCAVELEQQRERELEHARLKVLEQMYLPSVVEIAITGQFMRTCLNCDHFKDEHCQLAKPPQKPPAKIIMFGCDSHSEEIPF